MSILVELVLMNNFATAFAFVAAFESAPIVRLKKTWERVENRASGRGGKGEEIEGGGKKFGTSLWSEFQHVLPFLFISILLARLVLLLLLLLLLLFFFFSFLFILLFFSL